MYSEGEAYNQKFFGAGKVLWNGWNRDTSIYVSCAKGLAGKNFGIFPPRLPENCILN